MGSPSGRLARGAIVVIAMAAIGAGLALPAGAYHEPEEYFRFRDGQITESSGVATSSKRDGVLYTHNDSGDTARFFAVDDRGCTIAVFDLDDTSIIAEDWEDMARGPDARGNASLWFGDIGDNAVRRRTVRVYRVEEPNVTRRFAANPAAECPPTRARTIRATGFDFTYDDGPRNAEALLVHPRTGRLYVVSKVENGDAALYEAPLRPSTKRPNVLRKVAGISGIPTVTGGDIDPNGSRFVLRTYTAAYEWQIPDGDVAAAFTEQPRQIAFPSMPQGEAIAYTRDSSALVTTSEGAGSTVYRLDDHP